MIPSLIHGLRGFLSGDGALILPELELLLFAAGILVIDHWLAENEKYWNAALALAGTAFSAFTLYVQHGKIQAAHAADPEASELLGFHQSVLVDPFFLFFAALFLAVTVLVILLSVHRPGASGEQRGAYYALLLTACAGMMLAASGVNVVVALGGIELLAASCYLLLRRENQHGREFSTRSYAALWACSSVVLALGFLLLYGNFRTANLGRMAVTVDARLDKGLLFGGLTEWHVALGLALAAAGTLLLCEAAPLHWFTPGIYESGARPVAAFVTAAGKVTGFVVLLRLFSFLFLFAQPKWLYVWAGVAIVSLLWGSIAALRQTTPLRLLAYGAVAHTGFLLLPLVATNELGFAGLAYYLASYLFATLGAFGVLLVLQQSGVDVSSFAGLRGLARTQPLAAWLLIAFLLALAGLPPSAGFLAKYYLVKALLSAGHPVLAAFVVISAFAAAAYYGRLAAHAFRALPAAEGYATPTDLPLTITNAQTVALTAAAFVSLAAGLYPAPFFRLASYVFGP